MTIHEKLEITSASLRRAAAVLALAPADEKNAALIKVADALVRDTGAILAANALDLDAFTGSAAMRDRLTLTPERIAAIADGVRSVAALPDPVGEVVERFTAADGLEIEKLRVPFGVIGIIYEARPNVTADCAALCLKTGNAVLLRGSASAINSNAAIVKTIKSALAESTLPAESVELMEDVSREASDELMASRGLIDVLIPRGGERLIRAVADNAHVPVLETGVGNCHVYVDASAEPDMAEKIVLNAKTDRPSVCNAAETLLINENYPYARELLESLEDAGVTLHGDEKTLALAKSAVPAEFPRDYEKEHLSLDMAVRFVSSLDEAAEHVTRFGTGHTEAIITEDADAAEKFLARVDAAVVMHNSSTRYTDGGMFGFGAEIGISTQKLHARGPMGLRELTSYKYKVRGCGQVRTKASGKGKSLRAVIIGSGFMAHAFARGLIETKTLGADSVYVVNDAFPDEAAAFASELGCRVGGADEIGAADVLLWAVKPQIFPEAARMYGEYINKSTLVLTIMAGLSAKTVGDTLGGGYRVVRLMPNLALSKRQSATAYAPGELATDGDVKTVEALFSPLGRVVRTDESMLSGVTALSGSGPAYICRLLEALEAAAVDDGFEPETARALALQTLLGTAELLRNGDVPPSELRRRVTSKGGTTFAALCAFDETGFDASVKAAYGAAKRRSEELSGK